MISNAVHLLVLLINCCAISSVALSTKPVMFVIKPASPRGDEQRSGAVSPAGLCKMMVYYWPILLKKSGQSMQPEVEARKPKAEYPWAASSQQFFSQKAAARNGARATVEAF